MFRLSLGSGDDVQNPSPEQIESALCALPGGPDSFAILSATDDDMTYLQTAGGPAERFVLEYQDGRLDEHYQCTTPNLRLDHVIAAFRAYLLGDESWKSNHSWQRVDVGFPQ